MLAEQAKILENRDRGAGVFLLKLGSPLVARQARVGQFVQLLISENYDPLLRRPFCFYNIDQDNGQIEVLYQVVGTGTELLSRKKAGEKLSVFGPLGRGFEIEPDLESAILIGGGIGWAALNKIHHKLALRDIHYVPFFGARDLGFYQAIGAGEVIPIPPGNIATDDGSYGYHGFITELVEAKINEEFHFSKPTIFACGPNPMLKAVQALAGKYDLKAQISLEARMACGFGVCLGCAVKKAHGEGYFKVCHDGPVFNADEVELSKI